LLKSVTQEAPSVYGTVVIFARDTNDDCDESAHFGKVIACKPSTGTVVSTRSAGTLQGTDQVTKCVISEK